MTTEMCQREQKCTHSFAENNSVVFTVFDIKAKLFGTTASSLFNNNE